MMGEVTTLTAADGFTLDAYMSQPADEPKGSLVVIQEIFGVNSHIRDVVDGYASDGYFVIAPAIFDRAERGVELGYDQEGVQKGLQLARGELDQEKILLDVQSAINHAAQFGKVGVVGYCFGGLMTWVCAARAENVACCAGYYGGGIINAIDLVPRVPTMLHFGNLDKGIPLSDVEQVGARHPDVEIHIYDADHGFNCDHRASYDEAAAKLARQRSLAFFALNL